MKTAIHAPWEAGYDENGQRARAATINGRRYIITKDGAGATPWRVYGLTTGMDATFYTLREAKAAAVENAGVAS